LAAVTSNEQMIAFWNGLGGQTWASNADGQDRELQDVGAAALGALAAAPGESVLDVGCGPGTTSLLLAEQVGSAGRVVGVDVSAPLLAMGRERAAGFDNVSFVEADAQTTAPPGAPFDAVFSRFGVMFFADPDAAFANLRGATSPDGRLAFVCWQKPEENPWLLTPMMALAGLPGVEILPPAGPEEPGPFAFADPDRVRRILAAGRWRDVDVQAYRDEIVEDLDQRVAFSLRQGPAARALLNANDDVRAAAADRVRDALAQSARDGVVHLRRAAWIVTARA
jgi:SAM-dependent methyltransferase